MAARPDPASQAAEAADIVRARIGSDRPALGLVLGSGLGGLAEAFEDSVSVPYADIPHWPPVGVEGHAGVLVAGRLAGVSAVALKGRAHLYEGHAPESVTLPVRVLGSLGIRALFLSNASGAINRSFRPGDLMLIADHINLMWRNPLIGPVSAGDQRFPDMSDPYDRELRAVVREASREEDIPLQEGVYAGLLGPSYETPAEVRMLERIGADAVGMSTVPEVITARAIGMRCFGVSCVTNYAAGIGPQPLSHAEVIETTERVGERFRLLVRSTVTRLGDRLMDATSD